MVGYIVNKKVNISGISDGKLIEELYNELASKKNIYKMSDLKMLLVIPTTDVTDGKEYVFTNKIPETENKEKYITDVPIRNSSKSK